MLLLVLLIFLRGNARAEVISRTITITWDPSPSENVAGYYVRYGTRSGQYSQVLNVGDQRVANVPNLIEGTTYFFVVTAYSYDGQESLPTDEFLHTPNPASFLNISTRGMVQNGEGVLIAGFIIGGSGPKVVVVRALGPSLAEGGIANALADPVVELHGPNGLIAQNDNWRDNPESRLGQMQLAPNRAEEAALLIILTPGNYTAFVRGKGGATGVALLEVYDGGKPIVQ